MRPIPGFFYSFKFKISALVIALVLFAGIGAGGVSLLIAESELRQVIGRQELSLLTGAAAFIDNDLQDKHELLKSRPSAKKSTRAACQWINSSRCWKRMRRCAMNSAI